MAAKVNLAWYLLQLEVLTTFIAFYLFLITTHFTIPYNHEIAIAVEMSWNILVTFENDIVHEKALCFKLTIEFAKLYLTVI